RLRRSIGVCPTSSVISSATRRRALERVGTLQGTEPSRKRQLIEAVVGRWLLVVGQKPSIGCDKLLNCGLELQPQHSAGSDTCDALKAAPLLNQTSKRF